jgi:hypothetical protein
VTRPNGHSDNGNAGAIQEPAGDETLNDVLLPAAPVVPRPEVATRAKQRARQQIQQNRFVIIGAGAIVIALLIFVATSMPHRGAPQKVKSRGTTATDDLALENGNASNDKSLFPVTDSGRPVTKESHEGFLNERDLQRTATKSAARASGAGGAGTLGPEDNVELRRNCARPGWVRYQFTSNVTVLGSRCGMKTKQKINAQKNKTNVYSFTYCAGKEQLLPDEDESSTAAVRSSEADEVM